MQVDLWRRMTAPDKVHSVTSLTRTVQELALAGIRMRHPRASERECLLRLAVLKLGPCLAAHAYSGRREVDRLLTCDIIIHIDAINAAQPSCTCEEFIPCRLPA